MLSSVIATGMSPTKTAEENTAALQAALDTGKNVNVPRGTFKIAPNIFMKTWGQGIFGQGPMQTIFKCDQPGNYFVVDGDHQAFFKDFSMNGSGGGVTGGCAFHISSGTTPQSTNGNQMWGGDIQNIWLDQMWSGIYVSDVNSLNIIDVSMQNMHGDWGILASSLNPAARTDVIRIDHFGFSSNPAAPLAGRGYGLILDGYVHTVLLNDFSVVGGYMGILAQNTANLGFGDHVSFIFGVTCHIDFPHSCALNISHVDRTRWTGCYFHGSKTEANIMLAGGVRDAKFIGCNITGAAKTGLYFDGNILDVTSCEFDWNSQAEPGVHHGILLGHGARNVRIIGGGATSTQAGYGIAKVSNDTNVELAATGQHYGIHGNKNW